MPDIQIGVHTVRSHGVKIVKVHINDWLIDLLLLVAIEIMLNSKEPFHRFVSKEMMADLKYPFKEDTVPFWEVPIYAVLLPSAIFFVYYFCRRDVYDSHHAVLGLLFSVLITGVITDAIKDAVGRPRPNFFWWCFPDGSLPHPFVSLGFTKLKAWLRVTHFSKFVGDILNFQVFPPVTQDVICSGDEAVMKEGYKSFPKGHTS
ncbi:hypothetical protein TIFTF001_015567 [Ficus carica]|uniref:Phosphatidic acid phosphatase type 2/haloperoxidase domain-containing protein n=1 Tax=Ficus carica TaxID=3494 RepID=A0AA88D582_FICCA|nr:hypothetical protein TIFTF001_015567 [Ficus carica]